MSIIRFDNVDVIFSKDPREALKLLDQGMTRNEILKKTGQIVGVEKASLDIQKGEICVLMGLSGSGKSSLLRCINGLNTVSRGKLFVEHEGKQIDIASCTPAELKMMRTQRIAMVFQKFALMPWLTVRENISFGLEMQGRPEKERRKLVDEKLELVGLTQWRNKKPDELSGGMQQRVGLARALASDPSILLMDEAFSALDPIIRTEMQSELLRLQQIQRRTIVFISHDLDEAMRIGDRIAIMKDGQVIQVGTPDEILRSPADDYVRSFVRGVDAASVFKAGDIARQALTVVSEHSDRGCRAAQRLLEDSDRDYAYVVNARRRFLGVVSSQSLRDALHGRPGMLGLSHAFLPNVEPLSAGTPVAELFGPVAAAPCALPVTSDDGQFMGVVSRTTMLRFLDRDTPPVPPPQEIVPPVTLNPHFPASNAPTVAPTVEPIEQRQGDAA